MRESGWGTEEISFIAGVLHLNCKLSFGRRADSQTVCSQTDAAWDRFSHEWQQKTHTRMNTCTCMNTDTGTCMHTRTRNTLPLFFLPRRKRTPPIVGSQEQHTPGLGAAYV